MVDESGAPSSGQASGRASGQIVAACVALGSNLASSFGSPQETLRRAIHALASTPGIRVLARSIWHRTAPVGNRDQPDFVNGACVLETTLSPEDLLEHLLAIEVRFGRDRRTSQRWGPRTLDLDLILYGTRVVHCPYLVVPHPRMHERAFVLEPLAEIAPSAEIPTLGVTVAEALAALAARQAGDAGT